MRTLTNEVAGLPAGTEYEVFEDRDGIRRTAWMQPYPSIFGTGRVTVLRASARVDGKGSLAALTAAGPIFGWHVAQLGINPETEIPCGRCGAVIPAALTVCPECGEDPDSETPCRDCSDLSGQPLGYVDIMRGNGEHLGRVTCGTCSGTLSYESADYRARYDAIEAARRWERAQAGEQVPARIGERRYSADPEAALAMHEQHGGTLGEAMDLELRKLEEDESHIYGKPAAEGFGATVRALPPAPERQGGRGGGAGPPLGLHRRGRARRLDGGGPRPFGGAQGVAGEGAAMRHPRRVTAVVTLRGFDSEREIEELECGHRAPIPPTEGSAVGLTRDCEKCAMELGDFRALGRGFEPAAESGEPEGRGVGALIPRPKP